MGTVNCKAMTDEDLIEAYYGCDGDAGGELDRRYRALLVLALTRYGFMPWVRKLPSLTGREELAEDFVGDTIVEALAGKGRPTKRWKRPKGAKVSTWLQTILGRKVATYLRRKGLPVPDSVTALLSADDSEMPPTLLDNLPAGAAEADDWTQAILQAMRECVQELPEELRTICELKFDACLKQKQIAERLGLSDATVSRRVGEVLEHLRACLRGKRFDKLQ